MNAHKILLAILLLGLAGAQRAHSASPAMEQFARDVARKDSNAEGALASGQPEVTLAATEEGGVVAAILGFKFNRDLSSFTTKVAAPLEKGAEEAELANLADLPGGVEATFRLSHSWHTDRPSAGSLTTACRSINDILAERLPAVPDWALPRISALDSLPPDRQWAELPDIWGSPHPPPAGKGLYPTLAKHAQAVGVLPPPQWAEIEGAARAELCSEWNGGRASGLLLDPVYGNRVTATDDGEIALIESLGEPCTVANLLRVRRARARAAAEAALPDMEKVEEKAAAARDEARAAAQVELEAAIARAEQLAAQGVSQDVSALLQATARLERDRVERETQRAFEETIAAAQKKRDEAGSEAEAAEDKAVYTSLVASARKRMSPWWSVDLPFLRKPPETVGGTIQCSDLDAAALLATLDTPQAGRVFRELLSAAPTQWFVTGDYRVSSQDFKYVADPLALNPTSQLVATKSDNEYNHGARGGISLLWRGTLTTLGWTRKSTWKAKPPAQFCVPRGEQGALVCATTGSGAPARSDSDVLDLQIKRPLTPALALHGQVFFDQETDAVNPHLIAYFLPQDKKLRGGIDLSFLSEDPEGNDGFQLRLFVGLPFSFGNP